MATPTSTRRRHYGPLRFVIPLVLLAGLSVWISVHPDSLYQYTVEDGPIEWATALLFLVSGIGFFLVMKRSRFLSEKGSRSAYAFTLAWALLMVIFFGEEISWGQRVFGFSTPESLEQINVQQEFNVHNIAIVNEFLGGKYRYLSILMITTGLLLPLAARTRRGRAFVAKWAFPVPPLEYWWVFVGAYVYGRFFHATDPQSASEGREFLLAVAMCCFAWHGVFKPWTLFRAEPTEEDVSRQTNPDIP